MKSPLAVHNVISSTLANLQIAKSRKAGDTLQTVCDEIAEAFEYLKDVDLAPFAIARHKMDDKSVCHSDMLGIDGDPFECSSTHELALWLIRMNFAGLTGHARITKHADKGGISEASLLPQLATEFAFARDESATNIVDSESAIKGVVEGIAAGWCFERGG